MELKEECMYEFIDVLQKCRLFFSINKEELISMLQCMNPKVESYEKGDFIAVSGDKFNGFGLVISGSVAVIKETAAGDRIIINILEAGQIFGEIAAFAGNNVWPSTVIAHTTCKVMFLTPEIILGNCKKQCVSHKQLIANMLHIVSRKAFFLNQKVQYLTMKSIREKLANYFLEQYKINEQTTFVIPLNRNELADFLNVTRPSLSREMCRMRDEGIIDFYKESVKILDINKLYEILK